MARPAYTLGSLLKRRGDCASRLASRDTQRFRSTLQLKRPIRARARVYNRTNKRYANSTHSAQLSKYKNTIIWYNTR